MIWPRKQLVDHLNKKRLTVAHPFSEEYWSCISVTIMFASDSRQSLRSVSVTLQVPSRPFGPSFRDAVCSWLLRFDTTWHCACGAIVHNLVPNTPYSEQDCWLWSKNNTESWLWTKHGWWGGTEWKGVSDCNQTYWQGWWWHFLFPLSSVFHMLLKCMLNFRPKSTQKI